MAWGIVAGAAVGLVGAGMSASAAGDAADAQGQAAAQSDATQRYQYDTTRADNAPFREVGTQANNRLAMLMGLSGAGGGQTRDKIRNSLMSQYTQAGTGGTWGSSWNGGGGDATEGQAGPVFTPGTSTVDEAGLNAAVDRRLAEQTQQQATDRNDPAYGSLTRRFGAADLAGDTVYQSGLQFGLDEGTKGLNRQAAAGGSMLSGATLKALTRFGNDYGSTKANESYNRFNIEQNQQYNRLAGLSGAGQQATNQVSAAGINMANNISASQQGLGNARGSAYIAQSNAWQNALNGGVSAFKGYGSNALANWATPYSADTTIPMQAGGDY